MANLRILCCLFASGGCFAAVVVVTVITILLGGCFATIALYPVLAAFALMYLFSQVQLVKFVEEGPLLSLPPFLLVCRFGFFLIVLVVCVLCVPLGLLW